MNRGCEKINTKSRAVDVFPTAGLFTRRRFGTMYALPGDQDKLELEQMDASKINQAIRECLDKCLAADDQLAEALKCLRELRRSDAWTKEDVDAVKRGVVTMLQLRK